MDRNTFEFDFLSLVAGHESISATYGVVSETLHIALCHTDIQRIRSTVVYFAPLKTLSIF